MAEGYGRSIPGDDGKVPESGVGLHHHHQFRRSQSSEENFVAVDFSYVDLNSIELSDKIESVTTRIETSAKYAKSLYLQHNRIDIIPFNVGNFRRLMHLDLSYNNLTEIGDAIFTLKHLRNLLARNNFLGDNSLPKKLHLLENLEELNLSGNCFKSLPPEIVEIKGLKCLYLGGNEIETIPQDIKKLEKLEVLYLGGNNLKEIPAEMGRLHLLRSLVLCENQLLSLPSTISCLRKLKSLLLHKNQLTTLPSEIVTLRGLVELSLRDNPLVVRFVQEMTYDPPSLRELAGRSLKLFKVHYNEKEIPEDLNAYLQTASRCVNPKCKGVYFDARVEHIKFVDFCGKYRLPLLQYLCSPKCTLQPLATGSDSASSDDDSYVPSSRMRQVLLG